MGWQRGIYEGHYRSYLLHFRHFELCAVPAMSSADELGQAISVILKTSSHQSTVGFAGGCKSYGSCSGPSGVGPAGTVEGCYTSEGQRKGQTKPS